MSRITSRVAELNRNDPLDDVELTGLREIQRAGYDDERNTIYHEDLKTKWVVWAADAMVFAARELRGKRYAESIRGLCQAYEYKGRNGGFLPSYLSDALTTLQQYVIIVAKR